MSNAQDRHRAWRWQGRRLLGCVLALSLIVLAACDQQDQTGAAEAAPPPGVTVTPVMQQEIVESVEFLGRVAAIDHVDLRARVQGFLRERPFTEGEEVAVDELLFVIEPEPYEAAVTQARANLERAEAAVPQTERALDRARQLAERGNISESALDDAIAAAQQARAEVLAREAELDQAQINLSYTEITAPIAGRISRTAFTVGNLVGPDSGVLASITALDPIYVNFSVSERELVEFRKQQLAGEALEAPDIVLQVRLPDDTLYDHTGVINFVDSRADPNTGTVPVRGEFPNPNRLLLPGGFVTVSASGAEPTLALTVPQAAIQEDQAGRFVLMVGADNQVQIRRIEIGSQQGPDWVVRSGLEEGDMVIVQGLQRVRPGMAVNPTVQTPAETEG